MIDGITFQANIHVCKVEGVSIYEFVRYIDEFPVGYINVKIR